MKIEVNEHGALSIISADETIRFVSGLYVTSITIGDFWFYVGRNAWNKNDSDEMFFFHLNHNEKEIVTIYAYLPTSFHVRLFGKEICN